MSVAAGSGPEEEEPEEENALAALLGYRCVLQPMANYALFIPAALGWLMLLHVTAVKTNQIRRRRRSSLQHRSRSKQRPPQLGGPRSR